jgi:hypothetical protein
MPRQLLLMIRPIAVSLVLGLILASHARAAADEPTASTIRVNGEATVTSRPDRVEVDLGVVTRAPGAEAAATANAKQLESSLAALRETLGSSASIETISYSLQPDYYHPPQGGESKITGYTATNVVRVTLDDVTRVGTVIDTVTRSGANQIQQVRFTLKNDAAARARALRIAVLDARSKAASLANALDLVVVGVTSVVETGPTAQPVRELAMARTTTPIVPGGIETTAMVTLTVEVATRP